MKKTNKIILRVFSISFIIFCVQKPILNNELTINLKKYGLNEDSINEELIEYAINNLNSFIESYNKNNNTNINLNNIKRIKRLFFPINSYYFDFDEGYILIDENYNILKICNQNPSFEDELFNEDNIIYKDNAFYYINDGIPDEFIDEKYYTVLGSNSIKTNTSDIKFDGQIEKGDGLIYDIENYVSDKYPEYAFKKRGDLTNTRYVYQFDTSYYLERLEDNGYASEGNCVINSTYSMLINTALNGYNENFLYKEKYLDVYENISNDPLIYLTGSCWLINPYNRIGKDRNGYKAIENMPLLYTQLRERAIKSYHYRNNGMSAMAIRNMIFEIQDYYSYQLAFTQTSNLYTFMRLIDKNIPSVIVASNSSTYGSHAMTAFGYYIISKNNSWEKFSYYDDKIFISVNDGWGKIKSLYGEGKKIYYDMNDDYDALFTCANESNFVLSNC